MDSDTDSESELPPGWEKCINNDKIIYINHINNFSQSFSPLKDMKSYKNDGKEIRYNKSCGFSRITRRNEYFIQKFDSFSTSEQVINDVNLSLKRALVIGGCSGIGLEIVSHLISKNCFIVLGCPNLIDCLSKLKSKLGVEIVTEFITVFHLDLRSFDSINDFCYIVLQGFPEIGLIIFSASIMSPPYSLTENGFETSFQINVLSQFYIQEILLPKIVNCNPNSNCRVVWLSCESHRAIKEFNLFELNPSPHEYKGFYSYALLSLCKILIVKHSKSKWASNDCIRKPLFFVCHPGNIVNQTGITRYQPFLKFFFWIFSPFTKSLSQAAATPLLCSISNYLKNFSGSYFNNGCICEPSVLGQSEKNAEILYEYLINNVNRLKSLNSK